MNKHSESFNIARHQYIKGYQDNNEHIFPTLDLVAKEFSLTLSTLRKKAANEGWYKKRKQYQNAREEYEMRSQFKGKYSKFSIVNPAFSSFCILVKLLINNSSSVVPGIGRSSSADICNVELLKAIVILGRFCEEKVILLSAPELGSIRST